MVVLYGRPTATLKVAIVEGVAWDIDPHIANGPATALEHATFIVMQYGASREWAVAINNTGFLDKIASKWFATFASIQYELTTENFETIGLSQKYSTRRLHVV